MNSTEDRLLVPHPVTSLFPRLRDRRDYALTDEHSEFFRENGYVKGGRVLDQQQIEVLRQALEEIRTGRNPRLGALYEVDADYKRDPERNLFHFLGAWRVDEFFHDLLWHPAITVKAAQLLESPRVRLWHDQVFYKPARHPGVVTWHQDYSYWTRTTPARHVTCWIGLDDSTLGNGCVHYVPRSHRWGLLPKVSLTKDMEAIRKVMTPQQLDGFKPEPMILKAGECTFHHSHLLHGSFGNPSDRPRRAIVLNFMHPETRSADGGNPLLEFEGGGHIPLVPKGQIIEGEFFPLLLL